MFLQALTSAFPVASYTQPEVWRALNDGGALTGLGKRGRRTLRAILLGDSGIAKRHFALPPAELFQLDAKGLNRAFEQEAPRLASAALTRALQQAQISAPDLDALFICTCTGYLCPGVSSHVAELLGLRPEAFLHDVVGLGCGAALPTLHSAKCFLAEHPEATVAVVAVEVCSAAFFLDDDPGVVVSACLFGDGASASIWRSHPTATPWQLSNFRSLHWPQEREKIRFVNAGGKLRNQLDRDLPGLAAEAVRHLRERYAEVPQAVIAHSGGREVIEAVEQILPPFRFAETRAVLRDYGNLSSPAVLVALEQRLTAENPADHLLWLTSFGAGFCAYAAELRR